MNAKPLLHIDWCSHAAARYAVKHWHYSHSLPTDPLVKLGVWEAQRFIGCVLFSRGANNRIGTPYRLAKTEIAELTRVALSPHQTPTSRIVRIALLLMRSANPGLRLLVSYADPNHGHLGSLYQALGWIYVGTTAAESKLVDARGRVWHRRQVSATGIQTQYGKYQRVLKLSDCSKRPELGKHKYLCPLDTAMRVQILPLAQPYPKRAASILADAPAVQAGESGAAPTAALAVSK